MKSKSVVCSLLFIVCLFVSGPFSFGGPRVTKTMAANGDEVVQLTGTRSTPVTVFGRNKSNRMVIKGGPGVIIKGPNRGQTNGIDIRNSKNVVVEGPITCTGWYRGVRVAGSQHISFNNVICQKNIQQGFLGADSDDVSLTNCKGFDTRGQHAFYFGQHLSKIRVSGFVCGRTTLACLQLNGESGNGAKDIEVENLDVDNPFAVNVLGCDGVTIRNSKIKGKTNIANAFGGPKMGDILLDTCRIDGKVNWIAGNLTKKNLTGNFQIVH